MRYKELSNILENCRKHNLVPLLYGHTGVGKTAMVRKFAEDNNLKLFYLDIPTLQPQDLGIMPVVDKEKGMFKYVLPEWAVECLQNENTLLFLDEINRADSDMQNACLQIVTGIVAGKPLKSYIVAACNIDNDSEEVYHVFEFDAAMKRRFLKVYVHQTLDEFIEYFYSVYPNSILPAFLKVEQEEGRNTYMSLLEHGYPFSPAVIEQTEKILQFELDMNEKRKLLNDNIGSGLTNRLLQFMSDNFISLNDILTMNPKIFTVPKPVLITTLCSLISNAFSEQLINVVNKIIAKMDYKKDPEAFYRLFLSLVSIIPKLNISKQNKLESIKQFMDYYYEKGKSLFEE